MKADVRHELYGCDALRVALTGIGFKPFFDHLHARENGCNWYACRAVTAPARGCETNDGKPIQIVVTPHAYQLNGIAHDSTEVAITGEHCGIWFDLKGLLRNDHTTCGTTEHD